MVYLKERRKNTDISFCRIKIKIAHAVLKEDKHFLQK
jgi:hypothetical protein